MQRANRYMGITVLLMLAAAGAAVLTSSQAGGAPPDDPNASGKYQVLSYDVNSEKISPETLKKWDELGKKNQSTVEGTRFLDLDNVEGAAYIGFVMLWEGSEKGPNHPEHAHDWGEVFGFIGMNPEKDPYDLGGEMEFWPDGEKHLITKSSLVWVPPGLKPCPIQFNRIDSPFLLFTLGMTRKYSLIKEGD